MALVFRNLLVLAVAYEVVFHFAGVLISTWEGWRMSDAPFHFSSFYVEYLVEFAFVAIAYVIGGLLVPWLFKGPKTIVWSWALCLVLLAFSPVPFGNASITDVGLATKLYFLASIHLPPLMLGLVASAVIALIIRRSAQDHGLLKQV